MKNTKLDHMLQRPRLNKLLASFCANSIFPSNGIAKNVNTYEEI